jgi:hypothetical protein
VNIGITPSLPDARRGAAQRHAQSYLCWWGSWVSSDHADRSQVDGMAGTIASRLLISCLVLHTSGR